MVNYDSISFSQVEADSSLSIPSVSSIPLNDFPINSLGESIEITSISENWLTVPFDEYSVTEGLLFIVVGCLLVSLFITIFKR